MTVQLNGESVKGDWYAMRYLAVQQIAEFPGEWGHAGESDKYGIIQQNLMTGMFKSFKAGKLPMFATSIKAFKG